MTDQTTAVATPGKGHEFTATIIVNTRPFVWTEKKITFEQVLGLAFPGQPYRCGCNERGVQPRPRCGPLTPPRRER